MVEARAHIKYVRISAQKLRTIVDGVKKMQPHIALDYLGVSQTRSAKVLYKAIKSAMDNGKTNHGMDQKMMIFKTLLIDEGKGLKRYRAGARGTGKPYVRPLSHITVVLQQEKVVTKPKVGKITKKEEEKDTQKDMKVAESAITGIEAEIETKKPEVKKAVTSKKNKV